MRDICKDGEYVFIAEWHPQGGYYWNQILKTDEDESGMFTSHDIAGTLEVIGNLYENPELLMWRNQWSNSWPNKN